MLTVKEIIERTKARSQAGLIPISYNVSKKVTVKTSPPSLTRHHLPCIHRGEPTGRTTTCNSCQGKVSLKIFQCALPIYEECTIGKRTADVKGCCNDCPDYITHRERLKNE